MGSSTPFFYHFKIRSFSLMKNLRIKATGELRENVDNAEAAALVHGGLAEEIPASFQVIDHRDPVPAVIQNRDPKPAK